MAALFYSDSNDAIICIQMPVNEFKRRLVRTAHPTVDAAMKAGGRVRSMRHFA